MLLQCTQDVPYKLHYNIFLQPLLFIWITVITCGSIKLFPQKKEKGAGLSGFIFSRRKRKMKMPSSVLTQQCFPLLLPPFSLKQMFHFSQRLVGSWSIVWEFWPWSHRADRNSSNPSPAFGHPLCLLAGKPTQETNQHAIKAKFKDLSSWALRETSGLGTS